MTYFAPYVDENGFHYPTYKEILKEYIEAARKIFGKDIYLENDSADYQLLSILALKESDMLQACAMMFASKSPVSATGVALDALVKLNGIERMAGTYSTADLRLKGLPHTLISNGSAKDVNGVIWELPENVTLDGDGDLTVTATCQDKGPIYAAPGEIKFINTPTYGWKSVSNENAAMVGRERESDAELRRRQRISVALPSRTMLDGVQGALKAIHNVSRVRVYENDTNISKESEENPYGLPAHSITCIVEGGDKTEIAENIFLHKGIGCYTNGDIKVSVVDRSGYANVIRFKRPKERAVKVKLKLRPYAGYSSGIADKIEKEIIKSINGYDIGVGVSVGVLIAGAMGINRDADSPAFSIEEMSIAPSHTESYHQSLTPAYDEFLTCTGVNISEV